MTSTFRTKRIRTITGLLMLGIAGLIGYAAYGAAMAAGQPTAVVTVNLGAVLEKLDQRAVAEADLKTMMDVLRTEDTRQKDELIKMENELKAKEASAAKDDLQEAYAMARLKYESWARFNSDKMDIESSLILRDLYQSIKAAIEQMAASSKFDLVLVDDSQGDLTVNPEAKVSREAQVRQQIADRQMLYANPLIDITEDLIIRMNNAFKAGGKAVAKPAAGPAGVGAAKPKSP